MKVQCCVCKCVREGERWVAKRPADLEAQTFSHGYCPDCAAKAFDEIRRLNHAKLAASGHGNT